MSYNATEINQNQWEDVHDASSSENVSEVHYDVTCGYHKLEWNVEILGHCRRIYIVYRLCVCGQRLTKHQVAKKRTLHISEIRDGIELHLNPDCIYVTKRWPGGQLRLEKVCYCARNTVF